MNVHIKKSGIQIFSPTGAGYFHRQKRTGWEGIIPSALLPKVRKQMLKLGTKGLFWNKQPKLVQEEIKAPEP